MMLQALQQDVEYVDVRHREPTSFYAKWVDQSSAKHATPELIAADALRRLYPGYSLVLSEDHRLGNVLTTLPGITIHPSDSTKEAEFRGLYNVTFRPQLGRIGGKLSGSLVDDVIVGSHKITWNGNDFVVHSAKFQLSNMIKVAHFILHDGPEQPPRDFVLAACLYAEQIHDEIWIFNRGFWTKDRALWLEIQTSYWDDVIMKEENKQALQKDIYGFFKAEMTYKKLSIPWKRGLIMYGPPGNGKTISIKVIIKTCTERGFTPLYVKSFQGPMGEEGSMQSVFSHARQMAPCVLILEDLDSLINDRNRSFFLNQLDGLEGNDGLLVIATTNHFDKLDPGLSSRPSRFDRRYLFDDPDHQSRALYAKYWQEKLKDNDEISFPDSLAQEVADLTEGFSFAYLKEAFVSALVRITNTEVDKRVPFPVVLKDQIMSLRKELGKGTNSQPVIVFPRSFPSLPGKLPPTDERVPVISSQEEDSAQRSRDLRPTLLPSDVSPSESVPMARICAYPSPPRPRPRRVICGTPVVQQAQVLHAPPSAYPQVMPGSLPATSTDPVPPPWYRPRPAPGPSTSANDVGANQRNPFSTDITNGKPLPVKIVDDSDSDA